MGGAEEAAPEQPATDKAPDAEKPAEKAEKVKKEKYPDGAVRLHVMDLNEDTTIEQVRTLFEAHGAVIDAELKTNRGRADGKSRGFGFVIMSSKDDATKAVGALNGKEVDGKSMKVEVVEGKTKDKGKAEKGKASSPKGGEAKGKAKGDAKGKGKGKAAGKAVHAAQPQLHDAAFAANPYAAYGGYPAYPHPSYPMPYGYPYAAPMPMPGYPGYPVPQMQMPMPYAYPPPMPYAYPPAFPGTPAAMGMHPFGFGLPGPLPADPFMAAAPQAEPVPAARHSVEASPKGKGKGKDQKGKGKGKGKAKDDGEKKPAPPSGKVFTGKLKSISPKNGYGFIECAETEALYSRDVYVDSKLVPENANSGDVLRFNVDMSDKGHPRAINIQK